MENKYRRGDIIYVDLGNVAGCEQGGTRPCIIIQNDIGNKYSPTTIICPLTSKIHKKSLPTHAFLEKSDYPFLTTNSIVLCEQIRTVNESRLKDKIGSITGQGMEYVNKALIASMGLGE